MPDHSTPAGPADPQHADTPTAQPSEPTHREARASSDAPGKRPRHRRRATTPPPDGSDPSPAPEPPRHASTENDEQLKRDKPPHWG